MVTGADIMVATTIIGTETTTTTTIITMAVEEVLLTLTTEEDMPEDASLIMLTAEEDEAIHTLPTLQRELALMATQDLQVFQVREMLIIHQRELMR